jgi:hypothetical protein
MKHTPDLSELYRLLTFRRPHLSAGEETFFQTYAIGDRDSFGNAILDIGPGPPVTLFSAHTDTVHRTDGIQEIEARGGWIALHPFELCSECLGADDGTGVWILRHMIRNRVPGRYVFHRGEEVGCAGSQFILNETPEVLDGIRHAVAFDRAGTDSIVTHQMGRRTASDVFADKLAGYLDKGGLSYAPDPGGVYTDTEVYAPIVPECTNLSVGYESQHSTKEIQNIAHAMALAAAVLRVPWADLPVERDPAGWAADPWGWEEEPEETGDMCAVCGRAVLLTTGEAPSLYWRGGELCSLCSADLYD